MLYQDQILYEEAIIVMEKDTLLETACRESSIVVDGGIEGRWLDLQEIWTSVMDISSS